MGRVMFNILKLLFLLLTTITFNAFGFDSNEEKMESVLIANLEIIIKRLKKENALLI
jgi:hypothetical protein